MLTRREILRLAGAAPLAASPGFTWRDVSPASVELSYNGHPALVYNYGMMLKPGVPENYRRADYIHPVYSPSGVVVTDDFPKDHFHHRGISWMWPVVRVDGQEYDPWAVRGLPARFVRWIAREAGSRSARIAAENGWFLGDRRVVKETAEIGAAPGVIRLALTLEAIDRPVEICGTAEGNKGYGGFSFRFAPRKDTVVRTDKGVEEKDTDMIPHPWAELSGTYVEGKATARVKDDQSNPGYPNGWCLRHYGFLGVNYPGRTPVKLAPGKPLRLRYRITLA